MGVALLAAGALAAPAVAAPPPRLAQALASWTTGHPATGVHVVRLDPSGPVDVLAFAADTPRRPASTMKIVTAAGALTTLGPRYRFQTRLYLGSTATYDGPVLRTAVYLKGYGDPTLSTPAYNRRYLGGRGASVAALVRPLRSYGIRRIAGPIVVDETFLDANRRVPGWPARYAIECQPLSGATLNQSWLGNRRGTYARRPAVAAGVQLRAAMRAAGVVHTGPILVGRAPARARLVSTVESPPLSVVTRMMLPPSDNFIAETLAKDVGATLTGTGSTAAGTGATGTALARYLSPGDRLVDGSGLDRRNRLAPRSLTTLLAAAERDENWGPALIGSLARGGEGTLKRRLRDASLRNRVRAKTGYLSGTTTLAGIVESPRGVRYAFALLMNDGSVRDAWATQDRIVTLLGQGVADPAP